MIDFIDIALSWIKAYNPTDKQKKLAEERIQTCNSCENLLYLKDFDTHVCKLCTCPIKKKIFSSNPCKKWQR